MSLVHSSNIHTEEAEPSDSVNNTESRIINSRLNDIGDWPDVITDNIRIHLATQGSETVQRMDSKFREVYRHQESAKGKARKLPK
ncbi:hypothetical protein BgiBS90_023116, partial [Biomphalaria glabrata]